MRLAKAVMYRGVPAAQPPTAHYLIAQLDCCRRLARISW